MTPKRFRSRLAAVTLSGSMLVGLSGCSFLFSHGPPPGYQQMPMFTCTSSNTAPVLDMVWGGLNLAGAAMAASAESDAELENGSSRSTTMAVGLGWGVLSSFSAAHGMKKSKQCRAALMELAERRASRDDFGLLERPASWPIVPDVTRIR